jgi:hypothetical protein
MKNNSETIEKAQFATSIPGELRRLLKMSSSITEQNIEMIVADALTIHFGIGDAENLRRQREIQTVVNSLRKSKLTARLTPPLWGKDSAMMAGTMTLCTS